MNLHAVHSLVKYLKSKDPKSETGLDSSLFELLR